MQKRMDIIVNSQNQSVNAKTLAELITELELQSSGIALAVNGKVIAQGMWEEFNIEQGDKIVVVSAVFGG